MSIKPIPFLLISLNLLIENVDGGTYEVESTTAYAFTDLKNALELKGITIGVDSAYRSVESQEEIMAEFIEKYGSDYAKATVAEPGTSEHHTGLVIDIVPKVNTGTDLKVCPLFYSKISIGHFDSSSLIL